MRIVDIKDMPNFNTNIKNGINSVSIGKVRLVPFNNQNLHFTFELSYKEYLEYMEYRDDDEEFHYAPTCKEHGALNKVSEDGIWRCLSCNEGCYEIAKHK